jgi:hypothetical protein
MCIVGSWLADILIWPRLSTGIEKNHSFLMWFPFASPHRGLLLLKNTMLAGELPYDSCRDGAPGLGGVAGGLGSSFTPLLDYWARQVPF